MWALWGKGLMLGSLKNVVIMKVGSYPNVLLESDEYLIIWPRSGYQLSTPGSQFTDADVKSYIGSA